MTGFFGLDDNIKYNNKGKKMSEVRFVKIKEVDDGMRLNRWFLKYYPDLPIGALQKLIRTKQIKLDGKRTETSARLETGQELRIPPINLEKKEIRPRELCTKDVEFMQSMVIYKDKDIIVINKPQGLAVQGGTGVGRNLDAMLDALCYEMDEKPKLVHRLDKETSGILVLARTRKSAEILTKAFRDRDISKSYLALIVGGPKKDSGEIKAPLEKEGEKMEVVENGKMAITQFEVLDRVSDKFSFMKLSPITGRTHQLRAHMEYMGTPIVGDDKYYGENRFSSQLLVNKLHLHAYEIDLSEIFDRNIKLIAKLPEYFIVSLNDIGIDFKEPKNA